MLEWWMRDEKLTFERKDKLLQKNNKCNNRHQFK